MPIADWIKELETALPTITRKLLGNQNEVKMDLTESTMKQTREQVSRYQHRRDLLMAAIAANKALQADGHPDLFRLVLSHDDAENYRSQSASMMFAAEDIDEAVATHMEVPFAVTNQP